MKEKNDGGYLGFRKHIFKIVILKYIKDLFERTLNLKREMRFTFKNVFNFRCDNIDIYKYNYIYVRK
jgi:hypothetical protein